MPIRMHLQIIQRRHLAFALHVSVINVIAGYMGLQQIRDIMMDPRFL